MNGKLDDRIALLERWVRDFTTHPHPDLGRDGVVCPYMVKALRKDLVKVRALDAREGDAALAEAGRSMLAELQELGPAYGSDRIYLVRFTVPYGLPDPELRAMVERVHLELKPEFVSQGFLVGDFWPDHETIGLHSPVFRPFASPIPVLAARYAVPADLAFLSAPQIPPAERLRYLGMYRKVFEGRLNDHWAGRLERAEEEARLAL